MSNIDYIEIGQRIKRKRKEKRLTQEKLAAILGLNKRTIINWEKGELNKKIDLDKFLSLCSFLDIDMPYLLGNEYSNKELETVCKYTGFSENTAKMLHHTSKYTEAQNAPDFLSDLFDNYGSIVLVFLDELEEFMRNSYCEKALSSLPVGSCDKTIISLYNDYRDKAALNLLQCQRLIDNIKKDVEKDSYIVKRAKDNSAVIRAILEEKEY